MRLKGKKIACFLALPHHTRFFIPLREEIHKEGGELIFIVPLSEYPFEMDLIKKGLSFRYFTDYLTPEIVKKINEATNGLMKEWSEICFEWDGFSRWPLFKQSWFFEAVIEEYFCMENFIETEAPDMFIAHHECNRWGQVIGELCRKKGVPFVTFQEGDYYNDYIGFLIHTEYSCADLLWGEKNRRVLLDYQCSKDKMFLIGNTHIDSAIRTHSLPENIDKTKRELGIPLDKKVILFLVDIKYAGITQQERWEELLKGLEELEKDAVIIFKWHPSAMRDAFDKIEEVFKKICPNAILLYHYEPYRLLGLADYCVTLGKTTLAMEGLMFGVPLFTFPSSDTMEDYYVNIGVAQSVYPPGNWFSLKETIKNGVPEKIKNNVDHILKEYFYKLDGGAVYRAIEVMSYVLEVKDEPGEKVRLDETHIKTSGRISFIVPSGKDPEALIYTLNSLSENVLNPDWECIVVVHDDAVREALKAVSGDIKICESDRGDLGALYNRGKDEATGELLVFLSPGVLFPRMPNLIEECGSSLLGVPLRNADSSPNCLGIGFDFNSSPYPIQDESTPPIAVGGGLIALKSDLYRKLGGFDEALANHLIEPDLCLRAIEEGHEVRLFSEVSAIKYKEAYFGEDLSNEQWRNRVRFFAKWLGKIPKMEDITSFAKELLKV